MAKSVGAEQEMICRNRESRHYRQFRIHRLVAVPEGLFGVGHYWECTDCNTRGLRFNGKVSSSDKR